MEAVKFLNLLKKHKFTLIAVPVLVMAIAFVLTRKLPNVYESKGSLSAGLVEGSQTMMLDNSLLQDTKVSQQFANLIQIMQMKRVYEQVSYQLIIHDLTNKVPFKKTSKLFDELNPDARQHAYEVFSERYRTRAPLSLWNQDEKGLNQVLKSMGYDYDALAKKMRIYRIENTDFINVEFESDSPKLSAFVVNTLCYEFITYYTSLTKDNQFKAIQFLDTMLQQKKDTLNDQMGGLKDFKIKNKVLNLGEYAKTLYTQIADLEGRIQQVKKEIEANEGALTNINKKFNTNGRQFTDTAQMIMNKNITYYKEQITSLYNDYIKNKFDTTYKIKIDSVKKLLEKEVNRADDRTPLNPMEAKQNLLNQKMNLEINRDLARSSVKSLQDEYNNLNKRLNSLVPYEAVIQSYEGNINVASQEYIEILKKYNQTNLAYNSSVQLKQIEMAMPNPPLPSKKMLLVAISGVGSFVFCILILFVLFYIDDSIQYAGELANKTNFTVLGLLPFIRNTALLNLNKLWEYDNADTENRDFKNYLRSLRFETADMMQGAHTLVVTSLNNNEGKSFVAMSLANAFIMVNKRVLLIDGNFNNPAITAMTGADEYLEDYFTDKLYQPHRNYDNDVTVLGNRGLDISLFEIAAEDVILSKINELKRSFDIIIIESSGLNTLNQSKEWINMADKVVAVFECNKSISAAEKPYLAYLKTLGDKFVGWVLNKADNNTGQSKTKKKWFEKKR
ncbi:MAG: lipopolysaccharide biosynthesis protein [Taibaiella sp.]|nr:lipopolysaccharide biosynthesis protein [Taibaiella sp.]